jgi:hypothetical protein
MTEHGTDALRLVAVDAEVYSRAAAGIQATRQLEQLHRAPDPLEHAIEAPVRALGLDIGIDL